MQPVYACAACYSSQGGAQWAYILTTVFMLLIPLAMVLGFTLWIRRAMLAQAHAADEVPND